MILNDLRLIYHDLTYIYISIYLCIYISMGPYGVPGSLLSIYGALWGPRVPGLMDPGLRVPGLMDPGPRAPGLMDPGPE